MEPLVMHKQTVDEYNDEEDLLNREQLELEQLMPSCCCCMSDADCMFVVYDK